MIRQHNHLEGCSPLIKVQPNPDKTRRLHDVPGRRDTWSANNNASAVLLILLLFLPLVLLLLPAAVLLGLVLPLPKRDETAINHLPSQVVTPQEATVK